jgi:16S rRNA (guanine966-N2)-methyltransferase
MSEKVRGAIFNALGDIADLTVFDPFAGSGALAFEALSRGARQVIAIDSDTSAVEAIRRSANALGIAHEMKISRANAASWLDSQPDQLFDVVLLDPPYDHIQPGLLARLALRCKPGAVVVASLPPNHAFTPGDQFERLQTKTYGDATLSFWRRTDA